MPSSNPDLLNRCKQIVLEVLPDAEIILYGSRARGDASEDSDFDLLILTNEQVHWKTERLLGDRLYNLELETGKLISIQLITREKWNSSMFQTMPFRLNVEREGVII
ncbi:MAG: nucleotidyltransferase domain-containing protein [Bacillota bacterium]